MHTVILLVFIDVFVCMLIFTSYHLGISNTGPMTLPTYDVQQCHPFVGQ